MLNKILDYVQWQHLLMFNAMIFLNKMWMYGYNQGEMVVMADKLVVQVPYGVFDH